MQSGDARKDPGTRQTIDASNNSVEKKDGSNVTRSGLLNALDGFSAPDNVLFVMTSNPIEALDPALLRPGRIDYRLYLGPATEEQKAELYRRFFPQASMEEAQLFVSDRPEGETMAEGQGSLLALEESSRSARSSEVQVALDFERARTEEELDDKVSSTC